MMHRYEEVLLDLLASSINNPQDDCHLSLLLEDDEWIKLIKVAKYHGVASIVADRVEHFPKEELPGKQVVRALIKHFFGQTKRYDWQLNTASKLAASLKTKGIEMLVLKGISFSTYYHKPELRECGDCDIFLGEDFDIGNQVVREIGGKAEFGTYKHSHMYLDGLLIENHRYITDFNGTKKGKILELLLQKRIKEGDKTIIGNTGLLRPCAHFNALHMIKHAHGNFINDGMSMRMIYDWAAFLRTEKKNLDWEVLYEDFETCRLRNFVDVMTGLCVKFLNIELLDNMTMEKDWALLEEIMTDTLRNTKHLKPNESFWHKTNRILARFKRMWHYRKLAIESVPLMIWNSFAFSSYMKRDIRL